MDLSMGYIYIYGYIQKMGYLTQKMIYIYIRISSLGCVCLFDNGRSPENDQFKKGKS